MHTYSTNVFLAKEGLKVIQAHHSLCASSNPASSVDLYLPDPLLTVCCFCFFRLFHSVSPGVRMLLTTDTNDGQNSGKPSSNSVCLFSSPLTCRSQPLGSFFLFLSYRLSDSASICIPAETNLLVEHQCPLQGPAQPVLKPALAAKHR